MYLPDAVIATNSGKTLEIVALIWTNVFTGHLASAGWPAQNSHVPFLCKLHKITPRSACTLRQGLIPQLVALMFQIFKQSNKIKAGRSTIVPLK